MAHKPGHKRFGTRGLNLAKHALRIINPGDDASDTYSKSDLQRLRNKRKENDTKQKKTRTERKKTRTEIKTLNEKLKSKTGSDGKTRAQRMALERRKAKLSGTYKKPKTAQELAKERIAKKNEETKSTRKNRRRIRGRRVR